MGRQGGATTGMLSAASRCAGAAAAAAGVGALSTCTPLAGLGGRPWAAPSGSSGVCGPFFRRRRFPLHTPRAIGNAGGGGVISREIGRLRFTVGRLNFTVDPRADFVVFLPMGFRGVVTEPP